MRHTTAIRENTSCGARVLLFLVMKTALYGRIVFGASAVLFGVIALMWYDSDTWQTLRQIWSLPFGTIVGGCLMIVQIAGGIGMQYPRTAHLASILLGIVYLLFSLACIPGIIAAPAIYVHYGSFFEQFSLLCGATALYAATEANAARAAEMCIRDSRCIWGPMRRLKPMRSWPPRPASRSIMGLSN